MVAKISKINSNVPCMHALFAIAKNTFREAIRDKILYVIALFGLGMIASSLLLYDLALRQDVKLMKDMGLATISIFGVIITIFLGSNMIFKEVDKKTIYNVLSKPIRRSHFLIGKFLGLNMVVLAVTLGLTLCFYSVMIFKGEAFPSLFFLAIFYAFLEMVLLNAFVILYSSFATPILVTFLSIGTFLIGRSTDAIKIFGDKMENIYIEKICDALYYALPNFHITQLSNHVVYDEGISLEYGLFLIAYIIFYTFLVLYLSILAFQKKEY